VVTPPLQGSGGIGRLMGYVLGEVPEQRYAVRVLDTRGTGSVATSCWRFAAAWLLLTRACIGRRVDVAHINISQRGSSIRKAIMVVTCAAFRVPALLHVHAASYEIFYADLPRWGRLLLRRVMSLATVVVVLGQQWQDHAVTEMGLDPARVVVVPSGVPGPATAPVRVARGSAPLRIAFLGRLGPRKGLADLLGALGDDEVRPLPWQLTVAGDGSQGEFRALTEKLGIAGRVEFLGWVDDRRAASLLERSDALVLPSYAEGLPMAILESLAHEVAVVATPVGEVPDVIRQGETGLLVDPGDVAALAEAIMTLIEDDQCRRRLAREGRRVWEDRYALSTYVRVLTALWEDAALGRGPTGRAATKQ
jgi:glycosyltransferase involved in cell wall biosynthesis